MTWAIVASANHLFIDMALGGLVILVAWKIASRWQDVEPAISAQQAPSTALALAA
jgi:hypothetical protein